MSISGLGKSLSEMAKSAYQYSSDKYKSSPTFRRGIQGAAAGLALGAVLGGGSRLINKDDMKTVIKASLEIAGVLGASLGLAGAISGAFSKKDIDTSVAG
ncbi:MAG: hypothetical protein ACJARD_001319 [Alphaproteobacteria bacterium]|jgi:hypothetical protein